MSPLFDIASYSPAAPLLLGLLRFRRLDFSQWLLLGLCVFYLINQQLADLMGNSLGNNYPLYHLNVLVELAALSWLYVRELARKQGIRWYILLVLLIGSVATFNIFLFDGLWEAPTLLFTLDASLLIFLVLAYFGKVYRDMQIVQIELEFLFWVSLGVLVFFAGTLMLGFSLPLILQMDDALFFEMFWVRNILILITNVCYSIAMLCRVTKMRS